MYCYDTMHFTEFMLVFNHGVDEGGQKRLAATNAVHPGMLCKIYIMAIALRYAAMSRCTSTDGIHTMIKCADLPIVFHRRCLIGMRSIMDCITQKSVKEGEDGIKMKVYKHLRTGRNTLRTHYEQCTNTYEHYEHTTNSVRTVYEHV